MNISMNTSDLLDALKSVYKVVDNSSIIQSLTSVLLYTSDDVVGCRATDLDVDVAVTSPADVLETGSTAVSAKVFYEVVRSLPAGSSVAISCVDDGGGKLKIASGRSKFELGTLNADQFPTQVECNYSHAFTLKVDDLSGLLSKTEFAMIGRQDPRYYLDGIFLHTVVKGCGWLLRAVATDGHRMALASLPIDPCLSLGTMPGMIIPSKAVSEALSLCKDYDGEGEIVEIRASTSSLCFVFGGGKSILSSKLVDGRFPEYSRAIPKLYGGDVKNIIVNRLEFIGALKRVSRVCKDRMVVKISLCGEGGKTTISSIEAKNTAVEDISVEVEADKFLPPLEIGFNPHYLMDIIEHIDGDKIVMRLVDPSSPVVFERCGGAVGGGAAASRASGLHVLMPCRV